MEGVVDAADMQPITWGRAADLERLASEALKFPMGSRRRRDAMIEQRASVHAVPPMCKPPPVFILACKPS